MSKKILLSLITILGVCAFAVAQNKQVTGVVSDEKGEPIIGATVVVQGTTSGTTTGADGQFSLTAPANGSLSVSFVGYETQQVPLAGKTHVDVTLREESIAVEQIVVLGYGSGKKVSSVIGVMDQVKGEKIENRPSNNVADALQGQVAGLQVMTSSGELTQTSALRVHGIGSLSAGSTPLILLDGAPISSSTLMALNQNDIQSINVLKDASATSIYGSRAANGVIYVVTKTGRRDREEGVEVTLRTQYSLTSPVTPRITPLKTDQYLDYVAAIAIAPRGLTDPSDPRYAAAHEAARESWVLRNVLANGWDETKNTNWWNELLKKNAPMYQLDFSVNGGSQKTSYYFSGNYSDQTGILPGSASDRYTFRTNIDTRANDWLHLGLNLGMSYLDATVADTNATTGALFVSNPVLASLITPSYQPLYDPNTGEMYKLFTSTQAINPLLMPGFMPSGSSRLQMNGSGFIELTPVRGLTIRSVLSGDGFDANSFGSTSPQTPTISGGVFGIGSANEAYSRSYTWTWTNTAEYKHSWKDVHNFTALVGEETIYAAGASRSIAVRGITSSDFINISMGSEAAGLPGWGKSAVASNSMFGRLEYNYNERYFIDGTLRNDASSRFGANNRNALFYSLGAMWNMKKEGFLRDNTAISDLRLKASYGTQGNSEIGTYGHLRYLGPGADYGDNGATWFLASIGNPNLTWEKQSLLSIGFDMQLWKKLGIEFNYYRRETTDMLMSIPKAPSSGIGSVPGNIGGMRNAGVDVTINYDIYNTQDWYVNFRTTFNYNKNQLTKLWDPNIPDGTVQMSELNALSIGHPTGLWMMPKWAGVDPENGQDNWYLPGGGVTNDYNVASANPINFGTSRFAPYTGGFSLTGQWKGLALSADFSWVAGNYIFNNTMYFLANPAFSSGGTNACTEALDYWKAEGDHTKYPALTQEIMTDSRMLEKGDFLRLKNLQLSYALPKHIVDKTGFIKGLKVWVGARNLWTITGYNGLDPEVADRGADVDVYPNTRQFTFGLELKF